MANIEDVQNVQNYYADLLIIQYRNRPKARATIKLGANLYMADGLIFDLNNILDIDTAFGVQLDIIGKILGCNRNIYGLTLDTKFFSFEKTVAYGYSDKDALSEGYWKDYQNSTGTIYRLPDDVYRTLLKFKAIYNVRRGSMQFMDDMYFRIFGSEVNMVNNHDLTVTYNIPSTHGVAVEAAIYLNYLEPPLGIGYTINYT